MPSVKKSFLLFLLFSIVGIFLFAGYTEKSPPPPIDEPISSSTEPVMTTSDEPVITLSQGDVSFQGAIGSHCYEAPNSTGETFITCIDTVGPLELFEIFGIDFQPATSLQFKIDTGLPASEITVVISPKNDEFQAYDAITQKITDQKYNIDLSGIEKGTSFIVGIQARYNEGEDMLYEFPLEF